MHIVAGVHVAHGPQRLQAHTGIGIVPHGVDQRLANVGIVGVRAQRVESVAADAGVVITLHRVNQHLLNLGVVERAFQGDAPFRIHGDLHAARLGIGGNAG